MGIGRLGVLAVACGWCAAGVLGADWPGFRGPTGMGVVEDHDLPLEWGGPDLLWKAPLIRGDRAVSDWNQSSPIVVGGRVFVTGAYWSAGIDTEPEQIKVQPEHRVTCYDAGDGRLLWETIVKPGPWLLEDLRGGYASPTPVSDGERVYAFFGSSVVVALDLEGRVVWRYVVEHHLANDVALAASLAMYDGAVIVQVDKQEGLSEILALEGATGAVRWRQKRPGMSFSHASPVITEIGGRPRLLVSASEALQALDPRDGRVVWRCGWGRSIWPVSSPVHDGEFVYCISGRSGRPGVVVKVGGEGDVTDSHLAWQVGKTSEGMSSPVIVRGNDGKNRVIRVFKPGVITFF
ncbi:MAG: outer membrane protein assembly factor BamB family protein, partial [Planctomycetota bacterium]